MALTPGTRLGSYEIVSAIGAGGMGEVYRARDTRLNRDVAIKVLPEGFAADADRLARFTREAQVLASLNHPNIAAIYGIEDRALVMELVEGQDLSELIGGSRRSALGARGSDSQGPSAKSQKPIHGLPLSEALPIARQIAEALEAAHEAGIIHRDLKPANVKVKADGTVKVLDFGLAKAADPAGGSAPSVMNSPTITAHATQLGMILGTAAYMSPEQAKGRAVDKRADIWAFGVVLYEMLTGRRGYDAEDVSDTLAAVLTRDVDWSTLPTGTPPRLVALLHDCLMRDPKQRLRDIGEARRVLAQLIGGSADASASGSAASQSPVARAASAPARRSGLVPILLIIAGAAAGIAVWSAVGPARSAAGTTPRPVRLSVGIPPSIHAEWAGITIDGGTLLVTGRARRPDGTDETRPRAYTRRLDTYEFKPIPGTDGVQNVAQSPDGKWLAFVATVSEQSSQLRIAKVPIDGSSPPVALADWDDDWDPNVAWLEDGDLLITTKRSTKFFRLPTGGGPAKPAIAVDLGSVAGSPILGNVLPGDRGVFFAMESWGARGYQLDEWLLDPKTGKARRLFESAGSAAYSPTGHIVFTRGAVLMAAPFDLERLAVTGDVTALPGSVRTENSWSHGQVSVSKDGTLISVPGGRVGTDRKLATITPSGQVTPFIAELRPYEDRVRPSRDGRSVAVVMPDIKGTYETWVADLDHTGLKRALTLPNADCAAPVWSSDAARLVYHRTARDNDDGIYLQRVDGTGSPRAILKEESLEVNYVPTSWSPDGSGILVNKIVGGKGDILFVPLSPAGDASKPRVLRGTPANELNARFSADGRFVAFASDESSRVEVYVASYGPDGVLGPALMVSNGGGRQPAWAADSRRLFYYDDARVMSVTLSAAPALAASAPVMAYDLKKLHVRPVEWDIMPDGRLLAIQKGEGEDDIIAFNVVLNWFDEVRTRLSGRGGR